MNEVNDNGRLDQPLVRPLEEAASGEPQGVRPSEILKQLRCDINADFNDAMHMSCRTSDRYWSGKANAFRTALMHVDGAIEKMKQVSDGHEHIRSA